jgi:hypothetical protein
VGVPRGTEFPVCFPAARAIKETRINHREAAAMTSAPSIVPPPAIRHPLGLPAGSIRAVLAVIILLLFLLFLFLPETKHVRVPLALHGALVLVLVFFSAHGKTIRPDGTPGPSPWWLPRGVIRGLLIVAFLGGIAFQYVQNRDLLLARLTPTMDQVSDFPYVLLALGGGFILGWLLARGPWRRAAWFQDVLAWISLLALIGLAAEVLIELFINPQLSESVDTVAWESALTGVLALYFGARS